MQDSILEVIGVHQNHSTFFFFFNDTATTEIYTLSLHDALPISAGASRSSRACRSRWRRSGATRSTSPADRKSTRLNSSHANISYAVFCLKKKNKQVHQRVSPLCSLHTVIITIAPPFHAPLFATY